MQVHSSLAINLEYKVLTDSAKCPNNVVRLPTKVVAVSIAGFKLQASDLVILLYRQGRASTMCMHIYLEAPNVRALSDPVVLESFRKDVLDL
jgi:hypothetical protein